MVTFSTLSVTLSPFVVVVVDGGNKGDGGHRGHGDDGSDRGDEGAGENRRGEGGVQGLTIEVTCL